MADCDLKSYFDAIHHQRVRAYLEEFILDKIVLKLIWKFLRSEILDKDDVYWNRCTICIL